MNNFIILRGGYFFFQNACFFHARFAQQTFNLGSRKGTFFS